MDVEDEVEATDDSAGALNKEASDFRHQRTILRLGEESALGSPELGTFRAFLCCTRVHRRLFHGRDGIIGASRASSSTLLLLSSSGSVRTNMHGRGFSGHGYRTDYGHYSPSHHLSFLVYYIMCCIELIRPCLKRRALGSGRVQQLRTSRLGKIAVPEMGGTCTVYSEMLLCC